MNDIISINIDFEKSVLELRTEELKKEIPISGIKIGKYNGNQIVEFAMNGKSFVFIINKGGEVIDYFCRE